MDIKEKIKKVLALSQSPNEADAMAAIIKAQELMSKYKIEEYDIEEKQIGKREVKRVATGIYYNTRWFPYTGNLANIIAEHFLCGSISSRRTYEQRKEIEFIGLEDDVKMAVLTFDYAFNFIRKEIEKMKSNNNGNTKYVSILTNSYMLGWIRGLKIN